MKKLLRFTLLTLVFALPFGTKKFVAVLLPQFFEYAREFSSLFVYATDLLALLAIVVALFYFRDRIFFGSRATRISLWVFLVISAISLVFAPETLYAIYSLKALLVAVLLACAVGAAVREEVIGFRDLARALSISAFFEALLALAQFTFQKSIGFWFLGEAVVNAHTPGVARVVIGGVHYLRSYGTLPHANILAGFLVMGLVALVYLVFTAPPERRFTRIASMIAFAIVLLGLVFTFSRSGWIVAALVLLSLVVYGLTRHEFRHVVFGFVSILVIVGVALSHWLGWAIVPRASFTSGEPSIDHRVYYNEIALTLITAHPFGVGIGNEVVVASREHLYEAKGLPYAWLWQPTHNIYLLIASEVGTLGLLAFLAFLTSLLKGFQLKHTQRVFAWAFLASLLLFGFVDHFPWDLHAGRLMLWVALGIIMGLSFHEAKRPI